MDLTKWTIEPHGDGYALFAGRDGEHPGLKICQISEVDTVTWAAVAARIVAANDLYEALGKLYDYQAVDISEPRLFKKYEEVMEVAHLALKKARGE